MADQKNQNQGTQDSQSGRNPQGKASQQPTSENLKNRDKNKEREEENKDYQTDPTRRKGTPDTRNEEKENPQARTSSASELRDEDEDEMKDESNRRERL